MHDGDLVVCGFDGCWLLFRDDFGFACYERHCEAQRKKRAKQAKGMVLYYVLRWSPLNREGWFMADREGDSFFG